MASLAAIRQYNNIIAKDRSLIRKALDSSASVGQSLIPEKLETVITNTILRLSPELAMVTPRFDNQKFHEFNRLTSLPSPGGAMGENAVTPTRNSTYARDQVQLKIIRRKGSVTNFLQDTSAKYIDASAAEMENHLLAHAYDMATYIIHGNAEADSYTFSGVDRFVETNRIAEPVASAVPTDLSFLDNMIDENLERQGANHDKAFLMSVRMLSKVSSLLSNVRLNQGLTGGGLTTVDFNGGWRLNAYRDIPIIVTSALRPKTTMDAVVLSAGPATGTLADGTYYLRVAPITYNGEELASAEVNITLSAGTATQSIDITLSAAFDGALYYRIYAGSATGIANTLLVKVDSAFTYDSSGTITGNNLVLNWGGGVDASVSASAALDQPYVAVGGVPPETVMFVDLDEYQGLGKLPYTNTAGSKFNGLVTINPLAITDDDLPFLLKSYAALCPSYEATSIVHRGLRIA